MTPGAFPSDLNDHKRVLSFMMHELRKMLEVLNGNATQISLAIRGERVDEPRLRQFVPLLTEELFVLQAWLAISDFYLDPEQFAREQLHRVSLFRIFDRARTQLARRAKSAEIGIRLVGDGEHAIMANHLIGVVPFLLIDNSIKYGCRASQIEITLGRVGNRETVSVCSEGPLVDADEIETILNPGVRGRLAAQLTTDGNGQGLALMRSICAYHEGTVRVSSSGKPYVLNRVPYNTFEVFLSFPAA